MFFLHFTAERTLLEGEQGPLQSLVSANQQAILLARAAIDRPGVDWGVSNDPKAAVHGQFELILTPSLDELSRVLDDAVSLAHDRRDDAAAIENALAALRLADAVAMGPPVLDTHHTASSLAGSVGRTLLPIASDLHLNAAALSRARLLQTRLCDESSLRHCGIQSMYGQAYWTLSRITADRYPFGPALLIRPMYILDADRLLKLDHAAATAIGANFYAAATPFIPDEAPRTPSLLYNASHAFSLGMRPILRSAITLYFDALEQRRLASVLLAARLFETDHGVVPRDINALVPQYLPSLPVDALSGQAMTLARRPTTVRH